MGISRVVFAVVAIAVTTTAVAIMINITKSASIFESRIIASQAAESGVENAIIRVLRDPNYSGETLSVGNSVVVISVTGTDPIIITSEATYGTYIQKVQTTITYIDNRLTISDWEDIY